MSFTLSIYKNEYSIFTIDTDRELANSLASHFQLTAKRIKDCVFSFLLIVQFFSEMSFSQSHQDGGPLHGRRIQGMHLHLSQGA